MASDTRSEKEKMLAGDFYNAFTPELLRERSLCKDFIYEYNNTRPSESEKRTGLLQKMFGKFGSNSMIETPFFCDYGSNIHWGENSFANYNLVVLDICSVHVGDYVLMGPDVKIYGATHPTDPQLRLDGLEYGKPVRIGNNVWIGGSAVIVAGVTIGDNSVIGAGSVVVKDIPANVVAVGNPCKVIKQLEPPTRPSKGYPQLTGFVQEEKEKS
ncbi:unnamed protein product [Adineta ricciae]|uniref:Maltose/galactoside acetyltransferase domain-containing protein n=1 Tax=Adineta ricciae TaxID=249248 RepID=A0A814ACT0_ADIRI|nr:unnamed protein product [Adineta ricciae]CAF0971257.1 unnamed protein product [Adineta ricciae]